MHSVVDDNCAGVFELCLHTEATWYVWIMTIDTVMNH